MFDPVTFVFSTANRNETSSRSGVEAQFGWHLADKLRLSANYAYLQATQPDESGLTQVHELRRRGKTHGLLAMCAGGGMGSALVVEVV